LVVGRLGEMCERCGRRRAPSAADEAAAAAAGLAAASSSSSLPSFRPLRLSVSVSPGRQWPQMRGSRMHAAAPMLWHGCAQGPARARRGEKKRPRSEALSFVCCLREAPAPFAVVVGARLWLVRKEGGNKGVVWSRARARDCQEKNAREQCLPCFAFFRATARGRAAPPTTTPTTTVGEVDEVGLQARHQGRGQGLGFRAAVWPFTPFSFTRPLA
jgi:hypothetical protein